MNIEIGCQGGNMYSYWEKLKGNKQVKEMDLAIEALGFHWGSPWTGGGWVKHWSRENGERGELYVQYDPEYYAWTIEGLIDHKEIVFFGIQHLKELFTKYMGMDITDCEKYVYVWTPCPDDELPF